MDGGLAKDTDRVKVVVAAVPFFPDLARPSMDKWSGFESQRSEILEHICSKAIRRVVFLSGDV